MLINILGHKALLCAYGKGEHRVTPGHVCRAVDDTEGVALPWYLRLAGGRA
jgi:MSHA biogenesis protein MshM